MSDLPEGSVVEFLGDFVPIGYSLIEATVVNGKVVRIKCRKGTPR